MKKIESIYKDLFEKYSRQGWWPVTELGNTEPTYNSRKHLAEKQKLEICIGAILTQNTSWKNVEKAIVNLNKNKLFSPEKLNEIKTEKLAELIKSSGYYNQKAVKIKNFIKHLNANFGGDLNLLFNLKIKDLRKELLKINGIGKETADSIILYAAKKPVFVVDAYTKRIFERLLNLKFREYDDWQNFFEKNLKKEGGIQKQEFFAEYHALLVEFGKNICRKKPLCQKCFLNKNCPSFENKIT